MKSIDLTEEEITMLIRIMGHHIISESTNLFIIYDLYNKLRKVENISNEDVLSLEKYKPYKNNMKLVKTFDECPILVID